MKNTIRKIALLSMTLFLASCNQNTESIKESTSDSSYCPITESTGSTESENTGISDTSKENPSELTWSESDLAAMSQYLKGYTSLPFPIGFTSSYVEASGTDLDGVCFLVYDSNSGDLTESYGKQLLAAGFTYDEENSEEGDYYDYYLSLEDSTDEIWVQIDYYQNDFEIFAWVEGEEDSDTDTSASFPYSTIASCLSMTKIDESIVPSFELADGKKYEIYSGDGYLVIGGEYDTTIEEETYLSNYMTKLTDCGYTLTEDRYYASNETYSIAMYYAIGDGYFSIQPFTI